MSRLVPNLASEHASRARGAAGGDADGWIKRQSTGWIVGWIAGRTTGWTTGRRAVPGKLSVMRLMVAAVLALALQLGAALPALGCGPLAASAAAVAGAGKHTCSCCADAASCACLTKSKKNEQPNAPATLPEREAAVPMVPAQAAVAVPVAPAAEPQGGAHGAAPARSFPGVTLAVAYCRWII